MAKLLSSAATVRVRAPAGDTPLARFSSAMAPNSWAQLTPAPEGLSLFLGGPHSAIKTGYATKMAYDPVGKKIYFFGGDHNEVGVLKFFVYDEVTNVWSYLPTPAWAQVPCFHGWEHLSWDSTHHGLHYRPYNVNGIQRWEGGSNWTKIPSDQTFGYQSAIVAIEWFPDLNQMIQIQQENAPQGMIAGYDPDASNWSIYSKQLTDLGGTSCFAHYSPQHKAVWFGGGTPSWTLDSSGKVIACPPAPYPLGPTNDHALMVCNPQNGNFITMLTATNWHEFDPANKVWTALSGTCPVLQSPNHTSSWPTFGVVAVPIFQYGVIVFIKAYSASSPAQMWVYRPG